MNKVLILVFALLFSLPSFSQFGVYVTADDFANNTPVKGVDLKETSGAGPSNLILKLADGSKRTFKAGTFWGLYKLTDKKNGIITKYRVVENDFYPIYTSGDIIACFYYLSGGRYEAGDDGEPTFRYYSSYSGIYVSKTAKEKPVMVDEFYDLKKYMNPDLYAKVEKYKDKNPDLHLAQYVEFYNDLAKKKSTEEGE